MDSAHAAKPPLTNCPVGTCRSCCSVATRRQTTGASKSDRTPWPASYACRRCHRTLASIPVRSGAAAKSISIPDPSPCDAGWVPQNRIPDGTVWEVPEEYRPWRRGRRCPGKATALSYGCGDRGARLEGATIQVTVRRTADAATKRCSGSIPPDAAVLTAKGS